MQDNELNTPKQLFGWLEKVYVTTDEIKAKAKLDSGAKTSSIHSENIESLEIGGREYVRFEVVITPDEKVERTIPVHRVISVRSSNGLSHPRYSVCIQLKIGNHTLLEEFTLSDRTEMIYPILLGRKTIERIGFLDCSRSFLAEKAIFLAPKEA